MTILPSAQQALERLVHSTETLFEVMLETAPDQTEQKRRSEIVEVAQTYLDRVIRGLADQVPELALRGANSLSTVNKALADVSDGSNPRLSEASVRVLHDAIDSSKALRAQIGFL